MWLALWGSLEQGETHPPISLLSYGKPHLSEAGLDILIVIIACAVLMCILEHLSRASACVVTIIHQSSYLVHLSQQDVILPESNVSDSLESVLSAVNKF